MDWLQTIVSDVRGVVGNVKGVLDGFGIGRDNAQAVPPREPYTAPPGVPVGGAAAPSPMLLLLGAALLAAVVLKK